MNTVKYGTINISYSINKYEMAAGEVVFDWSLSNGDSSDEMFETVEQAEDDVLRSYQ